jgi:hypothetical protein
VYDSVYDFMPMVFYDQIFYRFYLKCVDRVQLQVYDFVYVSQSDFKSKISIPLIIDTNCNPSV